MLSVDKVILTPGKLQHDLRGYAAGSLILCLMPALCLLLSLYVFTNIKFHFIFTCFLVACVALVGVIFTILLTKGVAVFLMSFRQPIVVTATRVNSGSDKLSLWCRFMHYSRTGYHLIYFHGYGAHPSMPVMLESTSPGDRFYLLLDKSDHIIDYYPCNDYEYVGELTPSKFEKG